MKLEAGDYVTLLAKEKNKYQAAIFMGNAFCHLVPHYKKVLSAISDVLSPKGSVIVLLR